MMEEFEIPEAIREHREIPKKPGFPLPLLAGGVVILGIIGLISVRLVLLPAKPQLIRRRLNPYPRRQPVQYHRSHLFRLRLKLNQLLTRHKTICWDIYLIMLLPNQN